MKKIIKKIVVILSLICIGLLFIGKAEVKADDVDNYNINSKTLYDETNTYNYLYDTTIPNGTEVKNGIDRSFNNDARYDMKSQNGNKVMSNKTQITVFTHGWNGHADSWGSGEDSLVTKLGQLINANIYTLMIDKKYDENHNFSINDSNDKYYKNGDDKESSSIDASKPIILVFNGVNTGYKNDYIYTQFNYAVSKVVYQVKVANGGVLPKLNLIGHSRGGLTNMQYALDHPQMIDSMYSFDTPYIGTTIAELDYNYADSSALELFNPEAAPGENDLANRDVYLKYLNRWNNNYDELYSNIRVMALGGTTSLRYLLSFLNSSFDSIPFIRALHSWLMNILGNNAGDQLYKALKVTLVALVTYIQAKTGLLGKALNLASAISYSASLIDTIITPLVPKENRQILTFVGKLNNILNGVVKMLTTEIEINVFSDSVFTWKNDMAVNIESQMADRVMNNQEFKYKGFNRYSINFKPEDVDATDIAHARSLFHPMLQNYVLRDIASDSTWMYNILDDSSVRITGYISNVASNVLTISSTLTISNKSYNVVSIGDYAFAGDNNNYQEIILPSTIQDIGQYAFYNCKSLKKINLPNSLTSIGKGAFAIEEENNKEYGLESVNLPNNLTQIDDYAFMNNARLSTINIPSSVSLIGQGILQGTNITQITGNSKYKWENDVLVAKDNDQYRIIYVNPNAKRISINEKITSIDAYVFKNHKNIKSVELNNVKVIGVECFVNSSLSSLSNANLVENTSVDSFTNTPWLEDQLDSDFIYLGKTLVAYNGSDTSVEVPNGITRIGAYAFESDTIKNVILPSTITDIGKNAFTGCLNLEYILIKSIQPPMLDGDCFLDNTVLYVSEQAIKGYKNSIFSQTIKNKIDLLPITLSFYDENNQYLGEKTEYYGSLLDNYIMVEKEGYDFIGYKDSDGNIININDLLNYTQNQKLTLSYEKTKYVFNLNDNDKKESYTLNYGDKLNIDMPVKNGYNFIGWYDAKEGGNLVVNTEGTIVWQDIDKINNIYARYEIITYSISYSYSGEKMGDFRYSFTVENPITYSDIPEVRWYGYIFQGWNVVGKNVDFLTTKDYFENIKLAAKWKGTKINYSNKKIYAEYAIVDMTSANTMLEYNFEIGNSVKYVTFLGSRNKQFKMSIKILSRNTALVLGLYNMEFKPTKSDNTGTNAIDAPSDFTLYLSYKGVCKIYGGDGGIGWSISDLSQATDNKNGCNGTSGVNGFDGGIGIKANNLILQNYNSDAYLFVYGGNGGMGGTGQNGQAGSNGVNAPSGWFWHSVKGDDGASGGTGGTGGVGGTGGAAIVVGSNTSLKVAYNAQYYFKGGDGGKGGTGGQGGQGGAGASDTSSSPLSGVGDPGNGGAGGNGGIGGTGGNGTNATNALYVYGYGGQGGAGGTGGQAGLGGAGGSAGAVGDDGSNGTIGSNGNAGSTGKAGNNGYNTTGDYRAVKVITYMYRSDFEGTYFS